MESGKIELAHGSGCRKTQQLIREIFQRKFSNECLDQMLDAAVLQLENTRLAFTTDSFVVNPIFFPGGDIGKLAVCGTVNDLAVSGAMPRYMSVGLILEEGFLLEDLRRIASSMALAAQTANVQIVAGDTKVVEKGAADKIFMNTSGIGVIPEGVHLHPGNIRPGDVILINGKMGEHGLAVRSRRQGYMLDTPIESDCQSLLGLTQALLARPDKVRCMRDATRGGVATTLNELAQQSSLTLLIEEEQLPISSVVDGACKLLGLDPLYLANEGKLIAVVAPEFADEALACLRRLPEGRDSCVIGKVLKELPGIVIQKTRLGGRRVLPMLEGDPLPRIC